MIVISTVSCQKLEDDQQLAPKVPQETSVQNKEDRIVDFNDEVMPILSDKCFHCHGPDVENQKSDFRLDTEEQAKKMLKDGGYGIVAGNLEKSAVHKRIHITGEYMMPPPDSNRSLSQEEKQILDAWIMQGAKYTKHWAYVPIPKDVLIPEKTSWARNEIDRFIHAKLLKHHLEPAEEISKEKWLRRVTFDLTGLPPTLDELDAFLADHSENAYDKVVDRLFDTDAYAERMTNEWMDVARYADSYGYQTDKARFVWPWRDWVIGSFKKNQRYKDFVTWQLAGDLLPNATREQIQATTFNRLHPQKVEGGSVPEEFRIEYISDRLHTFGTAFLGLTLECSRCHDHKYDPPLSAKSYYEMSAFFANIDEAGLYSYFNPKSPPPPVLALTTEAQDKDIAQKDAEIKKSEQNLVRIKKSERVAFDTWLSNAPVKPAWKGILADIDFEALEEGKFANQVNSETSASSADSNRVVSENVRGNIVQLTGDHAITVGGVPVMNREVPVSFSFWIKPTQFHKRAVVFHQSRAWTDSASKGYELLIEDGKLSAAWIHFWPGNAARIKTVNPLPVNQWTHVAVTYDGSSSAKGIKFYINGLAGDAEIVRDNLTKEIVDQAGKSLVIGERFRDKGFKNGQLDDFKVFSGVLSPLEVKQLWDNQSLTAMLSKASGVLTLSEKEQLFQYYLRNHSLAHVLGLKHLQEARLARYKAYDNVTEIMVMKEMPQPKKTYLLKRGIYDDRGEEVSPNTPDILAPFSDTMERNRLGLAKWLFADNHPLTARVTVNRYWQMIFSRGIVATPEDFGSQGDRPTHAELLDWLARDFMDHGWDVRRLLKQMVLSATYRQSTVTAPEMREKDPKNLYLSRGHAVRLTAEMIRDQALATSGLLDRKVGGASVKPYEVAYGLKPMKPDKKNGLYRRSVYTWWQITSPAPVMTTFDASKRDVCRVNRDVTASPLQALVLLNGPEFVEAHRVLGAKMLTQFAKEEDEPEMVNTLFRTLISRWPDTREQKMFLELYRNQLDYFRKHTNEAVALLKVGSAPKAKDIDDARQAAAAILANTIFNLDECLIKR